ncbi:MAG TPA: type II secretion system secretin GspD [Candidatus Deferrimicrobium sp.]
MRIPVLLIAGLIALGPAAHAAETPSATEAPPAAVTSPPPAPSPAGQDNAAPGATTDVVGAPPVPAPAAAPQASPPPAPPPVVQENVAPGTIGGVVPPPVPAPAGAPLAPPGPAPSAAPAAAPAPSMVPVAAPAPSMVPVVAPAPSMVPVTQSPTYLSIDFTDVELPVLIKFMSEQTKKNFIFDERVQGKITIISPRRVTLDEAYDVFLYVLQAKGFTTVSQGNTIKIIAAREARQDSIHTGVSKDTAPAEFITRLIPLQFLEVTEVVPLVTPLVSKDGMVSAFGSSNTLMLIDSRANIDRIVRILEEVDNVGMTGILRIYPLSFAIAADAVKTLTSIYIEGGPAGAPAAAGRARGVSPSRRGAGAKFLADVRTNSVIVFAGREMQEDVADLLKQIDIPASGGSGKINVYYLENADAEEVSKVLASLSEKRAGASTTPPPPGARTAAPAVTGAAVVSAELEGGVKVTPDKATNSLIIVASTNDYETLLGVIKKLDIRRKQVYVEAVIMEITINKGRDLGVEFRGAVETGSGDKKGAIIGGTNFDFAGNVNQLFGSLATGNPLVFAGSGLIAGGIAGSVTLPDGTKIPALTAVLRAAQSNNNINILSSPHLLTLDNKEAEIVVGSNVPFITSQARDSTNLANTINTVERKDVGITLRMTPHIHESDFVSLDLFQESSAIAPDSLQNANTVGPTTTKRSAKTSVLVKSGDTVVLGGMMQETFTNNTSQIPLLGDIPLLGALFRFKSISRQKTNLLIMLTPRIIRDPGQMLDRSAERQRRMTEEFDRAKRDVERTFPDPKPGENR